MRNLLLSAVLTVAILFAIFAAVFAAPVSAHAQGCPYGSSCPVPPNPGACGWGVVDRGPTPHAQGYTQGNHYFVVFGDTLFPSASVSVSPSTACARQTVSPATCRRNTWIVIPGLGSPPPNPTPFPTPWPTLANTLANGDPNGDPWHPRHRQPKPWRHPCLALCGQRHRAFWGLGSRARRGQRRPDTG